MLREIEEGSIVIRYKALNQSGNKPKIELQRRAAPSVEAHHRSDHPNTGRNYGGRLI